MDMYVRMNVWLYVRMYICMYVYVYIYYVRMNIRVYALCMYIYVYTHVRKSRVPGQHLVSGLIRKEKCVITQRVVPTCSFQLHAFEVRNGFCWCS
jgi:hypothetical protein